MDDELIELPADPRVPRELQPTLQDCAGRAGSTAPAHDPVLSPAHYTRLRPEPGPTIIAWGLPWALGGAVKYLVRAGHKGDIRTDLRKAVRMIEMHLEYLDDLDQDGTQ